MGYPNTLIFIDFPAPDPAEAGEFYAAVFGWENDVRLDGLFSRMVPGDNFKNPDGSKSQIGNLHMGVYTPKNARPHPDPQGPQPLEMAGEGAKPRIFVLVSDDDSPERILAEAEKRGAKILWRNHYWKEFNGFNHSFRDPWGNQFILWRKGGENPQIPDNYTAEGV